MGAQEETIYTTSIHDTFHFRLAHYLHTSLYQQKKSVLSYFHLCFRMGSLKSPAKSAHFNAGRTRTRPCVYCGAFFFDLERLRRHEEAEGEKFREEREKIVRERPGLRENIPPPPVRPVINHHYHHQQQQSDHHYHHQRVPPPHNHNNVNVVFYRIDRTVEEFGENLKVLLGNASERASLTLDDFQRALCN